MPSFAILEHIGTPSYKPGVHWDLLLEVGNVLRAWELELPPAVGVTMLARQLPDHRSVYLDYEGPLADERGRVTRWEWGQYEVLHDESDKLRVRIEGERLSGILELRRTEEPHRWGLVFSCNIE